MGDEISLEVGTNHTPAETLKTLCSGMGIKAAFKEPADEHSYWYVEGGPFYAPEVRQMRPESSRGALELCGLDVNQTVLFPISRELDWEFQLTEVIFGTATFISEEPGDLLLDYHGIFLALRQSGKLYLHNDHTWLPADLRAVFPEPYVLINLMGDSPKKRYHRTL